jgi:beta-lactam-binding protein with PASTA domain
VPLPVPPDLEQALAGVPAARRHFDTLPPPAKDRWIGWISRARFGPRRRRRLEHAIATLAAEHGYPVGAQAADTVVVNGHEPLPPEPLVWPWLLAFALLLLIAAGVVWLVAYRHHHHPAGSGSVARAAVPGLVGEPQARAARDVRAHGLQPVTEPRPSAQPKGTIVDQRPAAGTMLRRGSPVTLFVSQGEPKVSVPKVTGLPAAAAVTKLENAKLVAKILDVPSTKTPGIVVAEKPKPAAKAPQGSTVVLAVAKGGGKVNVPAVVGEKAPQAVSDLVHAGLQATTQPVASDLPRGTVVSQQPAGGERVQKGSSVALKLSKGAPSAAPTATTPAPTTHQAATHPTTTRAAAPQQPTTKPQTTTPQPASQIDVPHLADAGLGTALHALESAGLRATVSYQTSQQPLGQVLSQNPAADAKVAPRTRVQLIVSEGPNPGSPTQLPDVTGEDQATAQTDLENAGFQVIVVRRTGTGQESGTVVEEAPGAGTSLGQNDFVAIYVAA